MSQQITRRATNTSNSPQPVIIGGDSDDGAVTTQLTASSGITIPQEGANSYANSALRLAKELVAAVIGISLTVCLFMMIWRAFDFLGRDQADLSFQWVKDLLLL
jgi:hypothetical protein